MSLISRVLAALLMAGIGAVAAAETVYKWVDGSGQVHYTDLPPRQGDAKILGMYQQESGDVDEDGGDDYSEEGTRRRRLARRFERLTAHARASRFGLGHGRR